MAVELQNRYITGLPRKGDFSNSQECDSNRSAISFQATYEDKLVSALNIIKDLVNEPTIAPSATIESTDQKQWFNKELAHLSDEIRTERTRIESLRKGVEKLGQEIGNIERKVEDDSLKTFQEEVDRLCSEWEDIKPDNLLSDLGLIAVYVERAICHHVLPEVFENEFYASLHDLLDYLNASEEFFPLDSSEYDCKKILREARERWEMVCKNVNFPNKWEMKTGGWKISDHMVPYDIRAIEVLKVHVAPCRINTRSVSLKYAEQNMESIKEKFVPWQFDLVTSFIGSLRDKMKKGKIHHDNIID